MVWVSGGQKELFREVPPLLSPFSLCQVLALPKTASCSLPALPNTSQPPSFGISLHLGLKTILDPDSFEFEEARWDSFCGTFLCIHMWSLGGPTKPGWPRTVPVLAVEVSYSSPLSFWQT